MGFTIAYASVTWTAGDTITEAKLDNMVANDQAYDSHAAQGLEFDEMASPGNPAANVLRVFAKDLGGATELYQRDSAGAEERFPTIVTEWADWTPTYGATGAMTYTSVATNRGRYCRIGHLVLFQLACAGTTGGVANVGLTFTAPVAPRYTSDRHVSGACSVYDGGDRAGMFKYQTDRFYVYKYDYANWGLGANRWIQIQGFYEVA